MYQHIERISEGLCDTENWSNDAENWKLEIGINHKHVVFNVFL